MKTLVALFAGLIGGLVAMLCAVRFGLVRIQVQAVTAPIWSMWASPLDTFPREASALPVEEISDLVVALIPNGGFQQQSGYFLNNGWAYMGESPMIHWQTNGFDVANDASTREGLVRVRIHGRLSTILRQKVEEMAWTVTLGTDENPKFGPEWIRIEGGIAPDNCFGSVYDGCTFTAEQSLASPLLQKKKLCSVSMPDGTREVYEIAKPGAPSVLLKWQSSAGSGGETTWIEIGSLSGKAKACAPNAS